MNYISANLRGGLGNVLFKTAAAINLAMINRVQCLFSNEFVTSTDLRKIDYQIYSTNVLRSVRLVSEIPTPYYVHEQRGFHYEPITYKEGTNLLLIGDFQSEKYFTEHKQLIKDIFRAPGVIQQYILQTIPNIHEFVSIHVRRGDYVNLQQYHPLMPQEYYRRAVETIGMDKTYLIFSDVLDNSCEDLLSFIPKKVVYRSGIDWMDFYLMSMCGDNIIANSTFSWWAAYLNQNPNKKVIAPTQWFGPGYANLNTDDLIPPDWTLL